MTGDYIYASLGIGMGALSLIPTIWWCMQQWGEESTDTIDLVLALFTVPLAVALFGPALLMFAAVSSPIWIVYLIMHFARKRNRKRKKKTSTVW